MANFILPSSLSIRQVTLRTRRLTDLHTFYTTILGLQEISYNGAEARLSASGQEPAQLILSQNETAPLHNRRQPGLYHVAWLVPNRLELARALRHFIQTKWPLSGFGDHLVSEAIYFSDPDGNGIEVYADRPRETWPIVNGQVQMDTSPVDVPDLLAQLPDNSPEWQGLHRNTLIGHIHLQVSSLAQARRFYADTLGFNVMQENYPGALFVAAGGYHHHIGLNTWHSQNAAPGPEEQTGLVSFTINIPDTQIFAALKNSLINTPYPITAEKPGSFMLESPDKLAIRIEGDGQAQENI
ncbi:catechol-2,3-dioxygenase [Adhaeribacter aerolatus]|uniref:Catechol-2,3-dioxygenase n=1 Tax=Adhaeribacter aerolatus TaxID=670289 RepID=A0A512AXT0_9BACT|nr:VOC family protein [Adhaeribacter aerolatus]GEO04526.1 catechol-2,3-dioxygenase [Adhaeribacter aerolatus]